RYTVVNPRRLPPLKTASFMPSHLSCVIVNPLRLGEAAVMLGLVQKAQRIGQEQRPCVLPIRITAAILAVFFPDKQFHPVPQDLQGEFRPLRCHVHPQRLPSILSTSRNSPLVSVQMPISTSPQVNMGGSPPPRQNWGLQFGWNLL